jgi:glycosyltransferase involved in cell wall biosynthesis
MKKVVTVDVTAGVVAFSTGIQRVIRGLVANWPGGALPNVQLVVWDLAVGDYRPPTIDEIDLLGLEVNQYQNLGIQDVIWQQGSWLVVPDFVHEFERREAIQRIRETNNLQLAYLVHDGVPVSVPETAISEMTPAFSRYLLDVADSNLAITVSVATADELMSCLQVIAHDHPVRAVVVPAPLANQGLPSKSEGVTPHSVTPTGDDLVATLNGSVGVLCVGSSEPRKNHSGLLYACELLWQEGLDFHLDLVATRSWSNQEELDVFARLKRRGRPVNWHSEISDDQLRALYLSSDVFAFPSLHEGFGLPVIEALSVGLPVVTGRHGATGQSAVDGGCLLIDPNSDAELVNALRELITNLDLRNDLRAAALRRPSRSWQDFAYEVTKYLT